MRGLRALLLRVLLFHETQNSPCSPKVYKPKPFPEVPHFLICPSASHANRSPSSLQSALVGFRVSILSQQLSPSGSGVCCSQPPCSGSGKHVPCDPGSWWGPGRCMTQENDFSIHPSGQQKPATQHSWSQFSFKSLP